MEVHEISNVIHVHIAKLHYQRVACMLCALALDNDVLAVVGYGKIVDNQIVLAINDVRRLYSPDSVVDEDFGRVYANVG